MIKRVLILVEGQTEERFVKDVLAPVYCDRDIFFHSTILVTRRVKNGPNFVGGVTNFAKFSNDLTRLFYDTDAALVTTLLDYYRLPSDFPGMDTRPDNSPLARVSHVEQAIAAHFRSQPNFLPFLALHEYEAWLFSSPTELPKALHETAQNVAFQKICDTVETPEDINERPDAAPSKRILKLFPSYRKTLHGPIVAKRIGLDMIRAKCPHFDQWISRIEAV